MAIIFRAFGAVKNSWRVHNFNEVSGGPARSINFPLLSDPEHRTIDAYGLHDPAYDGQKLAGIPHPAVYVIDKNGVVVWAKVESNYRERPTNDEIRGAFNGLK